MSGRMDVCRGTAACSHSSVPLIYSHFVWTSGKGLEMLEIQGLHLFQCCVQTQTIKLKWMCNLGKDKA